MIPQAVIDQILDRTDIVEIISEHVPLKKAGRNFKANCPFHNEKTPSFVVSPDKQIYHCFGCSAGGNVIGFIMKQEGLTFPEAVRYLAGKAGIEVPESASDKKETSLAGRLFEVNSFAAAFYRTCLTSPRGKPALEYLRDRGFSTDILNEFMVGFAPRGWETLSGPARSKKIPGEILRKAGLTVPSDKGKGDYDRFRSRIVFPVFNERGKIAGFGGRVLDDSLPKYINTPETPVYNKSNILYGLNLARKAIREQGNIIIAEGYMDVMKCSMLGVRNIVAASGTALTPRQADLIRKFTRSVIMVFDSDQAGEAASLRGLDILVEKGMDVRIVTLPEGDDPDTFISREGRDGFLRAVESGKDLFDYKLDLLLERFGASDIRSVVEEMLPTLKKVENAVLQSKYLSVLAERLNVHEASLRVEMGKLRPDRRGPRQPSEKLAAPRGVFSKTELHLLGFALSSRDCCRRVIDSGGPGIFRDEVIKRTMQKICMLYEKNGEDSISPGKFLSRIDEDDAARRAVTQAVSYAEVCGDVAKALDDCLKRLRDDNRTEDLKTLTRDLKQAQAESDDRKVRNLLMKINSIHKQKV